jgi:hypothetical protein
MMCDHRKKRMAAPAANAHPFNEWSDADKGVITWPAMNARRWTANRNCLPVRPIEWSSWRDLLKAGRMSV